MTMRPAALPTPTNPPKPEICEPDMGTTLQGQYWFPPFPDLPAPPDGWEPPAGDEFDWDQDGQVDTLTVADGTVSIDWGTGQLTVTGVQTDYYTTPAVDDDGREFRLYDQAQATEHVPAAVGDVTGDGVADLIVSHGGHTRVLIGEGPQAATGMLVFADVGTETPGWHSPPVRPLDRDGRPDFDSWLFPVPTARVELVWDVNDDGTDDFRVVRLNERTSQSEVYYTGVPCDLAAA